MFVPQNLPQWSWTTLLCGVFVPALATSAAILYTRKGSQVRVLIVLLTAYLSYLRWHAAFYLTSSHVVNSSLGGTAFGTFVHTINVLLLSDVTPQDIRNSFTRGVSLALSPRGIGTRWQAKNIPSFPSTTAEKPVPSRARYLIRQILIVIWSYLFADALEQIAAKQDPLEKVRMYGTGPGLEWELPWRLTSEQLGGRVGAVVTTWFVSSPVIQSLYYRIASIVCVGLGISNADDWPPLFGSYRDAYTLRGVWGMFWHQQLRWDYTSIARLVTVDMLHLSRPSRLERYLNISLVFGVSILLHTEVDMMFGFPASESGALYFYGSFPFGIMMEDAMQEVWRLSTTCRCGQVAHDGKASSSSREGIQSTRMDGLNKAQHLKRNKDLTKNDDELKGIDKVPIWKKAIGFVWVLTFFVIVGPSYIFNYVRTPQSKAWIVPYSVVENYDVGKAMGTVMAAGIALALAIHAEL